MIFANLQKIGGALMLPISILPIASLLLRFGMEDMLDIPFIRHAGQSVFDNLPAIFAIGIAFALTKDNNGAAALAGFIGHTIFVSILQSVDESIHMGILSGVIMGFTAGILYNRYHNKKLPDYLAFFSGTRFVPIVTAFAAIFLAIILGHIWLPIQKLIGLTQELFLNTEIIGPFLYGFFNRLLLPLGLHHVLNSFVYFVFGDYTNPVTGEIVHGDLNRFFAGDPTAGIFMSGFFPVFMFGLPAVCLAFYKTAKIENRKKISGLLVSMALTSFLTGITEPIEFSFMFLAPELYFIYAVLCGFSMAICDYIGIHVGTSFSGGVIDYILNWGISTNPAMIIPVGLLFGVGYYFIFVYAIEEFNLNTIGRNTDYVDVYKKVSEDEKIALIIKNLGGENNFMSITNCATRLRLVLKDADKVNEAELKKLGAHGFFRIGNAIQVVFGASVESIAVKIKNLVFGR